MLPIHNSYHRELMFLIPCDFFNAMYSTQILVPISFNLTIPKSFITIMQLNLITITPCFLADLINFYEEKKSAIPFFIIVVPFHYYFFSFDYHIAVSFPTKPPNTTKTTKISDKNLVMENIKSLSNSVTKFCA